MKTTLTLLLISAALLGCQKEPENSGSSSQGNTSGTNYPTGVVIHSVVASPTEQESVTLKNTSLSDANISGWSLGDKNKPDAYSIPDGTVIGPGGIKVFPHTTINFQVNNSDETIYLKNPAGVTIDTWTN